MKKDDRLIRWAEREVKDENRNGIDDELEPPEPSSGTRGRLQLGRSDGEPLTGGDPDADWGEAESSGEETVGSGSVSPELNDVEQIGVAAGVRYSEGEMLRPGEKEEDRDHRRWELDPASSEDYAERLHEHAVSSKVRKSHFTGE
ncbi:MAG: DUF6335 family protein [Thermoanaerobaculia bacterium]